MENFKRCEHDEFCGGCVYQGVPYAEQLANKENEVRELFRAKGINPQVFDAIEGCSDTNRFRYRNKMEYTFGDLVKDGPLQLGMHKIKNFMSIITVDKCQLVDNDFNKILRTTLDFAVERGYKHFHKRTHEGLLRNLVVRKGVRTREIMINIVTSGESDFDEDGYVRAIRKIDFNNEIVGILHTINDNVADKVTCEKMNVLYGRDYYMEEILGLKFKVSAFSFFQTNVEAVERLYSEAISLIDDFEGKKVFDLYCGTGTISQILALRAKEVLGIEIVSESVEAAKVNAKLNGLDNCKFIAGDVFEVLREYPEKPDVIVVDPPRVGMSVKTIDRIISYGVEKIVYISCNPKTLAINLQQFEHEGYKIKYAKAFDNFPGTKHVETIVLISREDNTL